MDTRNYYYFYRYCTRCDCRWCRRQHYSSIKAEPEVGHYFVIRKSLYSYLHSSLPSTTSSPPSSTTSAATFTPTVTGVPPSVPPLAMLSTVGAFNGTGLTNIDPLDNNYTGTLLFFQHFDSDLRFSQLRDSSWNGGVSSNSIGARNPVNGTPITATSYAYQGLVTVITSGSSISRILLIVYSMLFSTSTPRLPFKMFIKLMRRMSGQLEVLGKRVSELLAVMQP